MQLHLTAAWQAHESDVKGIVAAEATESLVSVSRDGSVALWQASGGEYELAMRHHEHGGYVNSVAMHDSIILSGGQDGVVYGWDVEQGSLAFALIGHTDNVCAITVDGGRVWTGSWDGQVREWLGAECIRSFGEAGMGAVWAICCYKEYVVTGTADGVVRWWKDGRVAHFSGSKKSAIRAIRPLPVEMNGLAVLDNEGTVFIYRDFTVSNEWSCHDLGYAMDVAIITTDDKGKGRADVALESMTVMATAGEDRLVKLWNVETGECVQSIAIPSSSAWAVRWLHGWRHEQPLLAIGCSNGMILLFGTRPASVAQQAFYEGALRDAKIASQQRVDPSHLSDAEVLTSPGSTIGQNVLVKREDGEVAAYQWDGKEWIMLGTVVEPSKPSFEGKEYDHVFDVDVNEQMLKLPFNLDENPWQAAQSFILRNDLDPSFTDQIVDFILRNTSGNSSATSKPAFVVYREGNLEGIKRKLGDARLDPLFDLLQGRNPHSTVDYSCLLDHQVPLFPLLDLIRIGLLRPEVGRAMLTKLPVSLLLERVESTADLTMALRLMANGCSMDWCESFIRSNIKLARTLIERGYNDAAIKDPLLATSCLLNVWLVTKDDSLRRMARQRVTLNQEEQRLLNFIS